MTSISRRNRAAGWWWIALFAAACGGGGGGSPTAPPGPISFAGVWNAVETLTGASPNDTCWAKFLNSILGDNGPYHGTITQMGSAATLDLVGVVAPADESFFEGTADASSLALTQTGGFFDLTFACSDGTHVAIHDAAGGADLAGTTSRLSGTLTETYDLSDQGTGQPLGRVVVSYSLALSR